MGKHTFKGIVTSWDQIHQPVTILMDHNLRKFQKSGSRTLETDEEQQSKSRLKAIKKSGRGRERR
jgi:hypothetical protein